jgi:pimeloyl-ACP methyl ester carboxylesterase
MRLRHLISFIALLLLFSGGSLAENRTVKLQIKGTSALADLVVPENGSIKKGVILITHGTLAHKDMEIVEALQSTLSERGYSSLAHTLTLGLDNREGMYDCTRPHTHRHEDALDEIGAWLHWLKDQGAGPVSLVGHSRGGNQSAWFAVERGAGKIAKLVLIAPATNSTPDDASKNYHKRYKTDLAGIVKQAEKYVSAGTPQKEMSLPGLLYCPDAKAQAGSIISYYSADSRRDTPTLLPKLKMPTLVIAGSDDTVVPAVARRVKPLADGKKIKLVVIDGADHMFLDFFIEDAADLIASFINPGS